MTNKNKMTKKQFSVVVKGLLTKYVIPDIGNCSWLKLDGTGSCLLIPKIFLNQIPIKQLYQDTVVYSKQIALTFLQKEDIVLSDVLF